MRLRSYTTWFLMLFCAAAQGADFRIIPRLGDARRAAFRQASEQPYFMFEAQLPEGTHTAVTAIIWVRLPRYGKSMLAPSAAWCPEEIERFNPDLLGGAGGHGEAEIDLTALGGALAVANPGFKPYSGTHYLTNHWPLGVATVAGESEQAITVSVGGNDLTLGPGTFNRNVEVGPGGGVVISGGGKCRVGVSQTPCGKFYQEFGGLLDDDVLGLTAENVVTNVWAMCSFRWAVVPGSGAQIYRSDLGQFHAFDALHITKTNSSGYVTGYSSKGVYQLWLSGLQVDPPLDIEVFDLRIFGRWLSDMEMERIHANAVQEILRRWPDTP